MAGEETVERWMPSANQGETPGTVPSLIALKRNQPCLCVDFGLLASINLRLFFKSPGGLPCYSKLMVTSMIVIQSTSCVWLFATPWNAAWLSPTVTQTHVHWLGDAIQPFIPLSPPSSLALNLSQHQGLFQWDDFTLGGQYDFKRWGEVLIKYKPKVSLMFFANIQKKKDFLTDFSFMFQNDNNLCAILLYPTCLYIAL